jgi:hypothetical protein
MGDQLSVCTGMVRNDLHQLEETKEYKTKRRRKDRPKELTSYAAMASSNSTRRTRTRTQSNSNDDDEQEQGWDTQTTRRYHNIPIEAQVSHQRNGSRLRQRMDVARQQYRLAVGKAHTEKEGEAAIEIDKDVQAAKLIFLHQLECLKEEAAAKCMFALSQTITNEMLRVKEGSPNRKKRTTDTSTSTSTTTTTTTTTTTSAVKGVKGRMAEARRATQRTTPESETATDVLAGVPLEDVSATPVASVEVVEVVEPVLLTWEEEEQQRRKQVHAGVINERHKEKETAKSMLCDLLAANNLAKSGSVGDGAAFGNPNHASAVEGAAPSLSLSLSSSLAPSKISNISSIELNNLLQHVATRNAKSLPSN